MFILLLHMVSLTAQWGPEAALEAGINLCANPAEALHAFMDVSGAVHLFYHKIIPLGYKVIEDCRAFKKKDSELVTISDVHFLAVLTIKSTKSHKRQESYHCWLIYIWHLI